LNRFGRTYRERGYQYPPGAEDLYRARRSLEPGTIAERSSVFREVPLSVRLLVSGVRNPASDMNGHLYSFLMGGGSVAKDVSAFFSWTPFPSSELHHMRVGLHNIASGVLGQGAVNVRVGSFFLTDFGRPGHRALSAAPHTLSALRMGTNTFNWTVPVVGIQLYGRPGEGPTFYELAALDGDPGDRWKDGFGRAAYTLFYQTDHELSVGVFGYLGRADLVSDLGGVQVAHRDDFWVAGADLEFDWQSLTIEAMGFQQHHSDPRGVGGEESATGIRAAAALLVADRWLPTLQWEHLLASEEVLTGSELAVGLKHLVRANVTLDLTYRTDLKARAQTWIGAVDVAF
jgi:hypothetical protein